MPAIPGSVPVTGFVAPTDSADTYPAQTEEWGRGGYRTVASIAERNAIPSGRRKEGMRVYVVENNTEYKLGAGLLDADWVTVSTGSTPVPSLADLPAIVVTGLVTGTVVYVAGFASPGDGGGGAFYYDSAATDAALTGMVVVPATGGGRWRRDYGPVINARWFGAKGDAVTDDTAALQAAIDFGEEPAYGWADFGTTFAENGSLKVFIPTGVYITSAALVFTKVELYGKYGGFQSPFTNTIIWSRHSGNCIEWHSDSTAFQIGGIHDLTLQGSSEIYQANKKAITSVSTRERFFVAPGDSPVSTWSGPPNFCFFFDSEGGFLGHAVIGLSDHATGQIDILPGFDSYATRTSSGGLLTTAETVVFSPRLTEQLFVNFIDPAAAGCVGLWMQNNNASAIAVPPPVYNLHISQFHCGIRICPGSLGGSFHDISVRYARFSAICSPVGYSTPDTQYVQIYLDCSYARDYLAPVRTIPLDNMVFRNGAVGFYNPGPLNRITNYIIQYGCLANVYIDRCVSNCFGDGLLDGTSRYGLLVRTAFVGPLGYASADVLFGQLMVRNTFAADHQNLIHPTAAIRIYGETPTNPSRPVPIFISQLCIADLGGEKLDAAFQIDSTAPVVPHTIRVDQLTDRLGAILINGVGSQYSQISDWRWSITPAEIGLGPYTDALNSQANYSIATNGVESVSIQNTGMEVSSYTGTVPLTVTRQDTGYSWGVNLSNNILRFQNLGNAYYGAQINSDATTQQFTLGLYGASYNPRGSTLSAESAASGVAGPATMTIATPAVVTKASHGYVLNDQIVFATTGALPTGVTAGVTYYVLSSGLTTDEFQFSASAGGAAVNTSGSQSGTHTVQHINAPANYFRILTSGGTGNDATQGGLGILTPNAGASGATAQGFTQKFKFKREGHINMTPMASDPTIEVGNGDLYPNSTNGHLRAYNGGKWGNVDRWTVRFDGGTTVNVTATDELVVMANAGAITVNLPAGILNQRYMFKNKGVGTATLTPNGAETLFTTASVGTLALVTGDSVTIQWDGVYWLTL